MNKRDIPTIRGSVEIRNMLLFPKYLPNKTSVVNLVRRMCPTATYTRWIKGVSIAVFIVRRWLYYALQDMIEKGDTVVFYCKGEPYMYISIRDLKNISRRYVYSDKFRGHLYQVYTELSDEYGKKLRRQVLVYPMRQEYYQMSKKVQRGMDYEEAPMNPIHYLDPNHVCPKTKELEALRISTSLGGK